MKKNLLRLQMVILGAALFLPLAVLAGTLEPPAAPSDPASGMYTVDDLFNRLSTGAAGAKRSGGFTEPGTGPGATGRTLNQVMGAMPAADNSNGGSTSDMAFGKTFWGLRTDGSWGLQVGTYIPSDAELNISAGTSSLVEGDAGHGTAVAFTYTVTRTGNLNKVTTVDWDVTHVTTSSNDFTNGIDSLLTPSGSLTFNTTEATQTITVYAYGDTGLDSVESDKNFIITLSNASATNSIGATGSYVSTIVDDDTLLTFTADDMRMSESVDGGSTVFTYTVTRSGYTSAGSSINWQVGPSSVYDPTDGDNWSDTADTSDFGGGYPSGTVSFATGETSKTIIVTVYGDDNIENDEWFQLSLSGGSGYDQLTSLYNDPDYAPGTWLFYNIVHLDGQQDNGDTYISATNAYLFSEIQRDEAYFSVLDSEVAGQGDHTLLLYHLEGDTAAAGGSDDPVAHIFAVQRTIATSGAAWVTWQAIGLSGTTNADDFPPGSDARGLGGSVLASGTLTFSDGQEWGYIMIYTKPDDTAESDELFMVYLDFVSGGSSINASDTGGSSENFGYITNDD